MADTWTPIPPEGSTWVPSTPESPMTSTSYWVDAAKFNTLSEADAEAVSLGRTVLIGTPINISTSVVFSSPVMFTKGGLITNLGTATITFNGSFNSGIYQIFSGFSSGSVVFGTGSVSEVYPEWWGIDGTADQTEINFALATDKPVKLTKTSYSISAAISITSHQTIEGLGAEKTTITTSTNAINAIEIASNARRVIISSLKISSPSIGSSNSAIKANNSNGGAEHSYREISITSFKYGIYVGQTWWNNTVENVRWNSCDYSFYSDATGGADCINNTFIRCYSNAPVSFGIYLNRFQNTIFNTCNFGGTSTGNAEYVVLISSDTAIKFLGCNFEGNSRNQNFGHITAWSNSTVMFDSCTFVSNAGIGASGAYMLLARDTSIIQVRNCKYINAGANMVPFRVQNAGTITQLDGLMAQIVSGSSTARQVRAYWYNSPNMGDTASRPTLASYDIGVLYLDTTLAAAGKPIWWNGTAWVDATGATI